MAVVGRVKGVGLIGWVNKRPVVQGTPSTCSEGARNARFIIEVKLKYVGLELFRFPEWSEAQKLPKEVLLFCRNVLHYLGKNDKDFIHEDWGGLEDNDDDEDDYDENDYTRYDH